MQLIVLFFL